MLAIYIYILVYSSSGIILMRNFSVGQHLVQFQQIPGMLWKLLYTSRNKAWDFLEHQNMAVSSQFPIIYLLISPPCHYLLIVTGWELGDKISQKKNITFLEQECRGVPM